MAKSRKYKKSRDLKNLPRVSKLRFRDKNTQGMLCDKLREPFPNYNKAPCETVLEGENNNFIVLGRDRTASIASGYGGLGHTQAGSIDIVVGRGGPDTPEQTKDGEKLYADPNFDKDAARIHISQKTDVDKNMFLVDGRVGDAKAKSAIAMKADHIRLAAREGIKIVTRVGTHNSRGGELKSVSGIDLIAGNNDKGLEPMVKGRKIVTALKALAEEIENLNGIVETFLINQMQYNEQIATHFHYSPFGGIRTSESFSLMPDGMATCTNLLLQTHSSLFMNKGNLQVYKTKYLTPSGTGWILSRYNNVN